MIARLLFGEDVFISYSRADGSHYAAGLADALTSMRFSCFIDQLGTDPDKDLPKSLKAKIRNSSLLVLVGTKRALVSQSVRKELEEFKTTKRPIVPIYFDEVTEDSPLNSIIPGIASSIEYPESFETGSPSPAVVGRIVKSFNYSRRNEKLRRMIWATVVTVVLLLGGAIGISTLIMRRANQAAQLLQIKVQEALARAQTAEASATKANDEAQAALKDAKEARDQANYESAGRVRAEQNRR